MEMKILKALLFEDIISEIKFKYVIEKEVTSGHFDYDKIRKFCKLLY